MCFDNNFYFNKSIYLFFLHNLNNFVNIRTPVVERWLIQMKRLVAAPALLVLSRVLFTIESTNPLRSGGEEVAYIGMTVFQQQYIYLYIILGLYL